MIFEEYIFQRIQGESYRGAHVSQHNRLPFEKVIAVLSVIREHAGRDKFKIHVGDWNEQKGKQQEAGTYYTIVDSINTKLGQGTVNSIKKNLFTDFSRMGYLEKFNKHGQTINPRKRGIAESVALTDKAFALLDQNDEGAQYRQFTEGVGELVGPISRELYPIVKDLGFLNIYEYMFVASDPDLSAPDKIKLIKNYRSLKKIKRVALNLQIQKLFDENNKAAADKPELRDFGNWYNQALQTFGLLNQNVVFKTFNLTVLMLSTSQEALELVKVRSEVEKQKYFDWHGVSKTAGYDLHHIYPITYATTLNELKSLDHHKNMVYISNPQHKKIPRFNNLLVQLESNSGALVLKDVDSTRSLDITAEVVINPANVPEMLQYNQELIKTIS